MNMRKMIVTLSLTGPERQAYFEGDSFIASGDTGDEAAVNLLRDSGSPAGEYVCEVQLRPPAKAAVHSWISKWTPPDSLVYDFAESGSYSPRNSSA